MITYIKYKFNEWKVKKIFYGAIVQLMDNQDEIKDMIITDRLFENSLIQGSLSGRYDFLDVILSPIKVILLGDLLYV